MDDGPHERAHEPAHDAAGGLLAQATGALRRHTPTGWAAVRGDLLELARRAHRPSAPVRGRHALGDFLLASDVLVAELRRAVDALEDLAVTAVHCATADEGVLTGVLTGVTVEVAALFGTHLPTAGAAARDALTDRLVTVLGELSPPADRVEVHVHVGDVVARRVDL